MRLSIMSGRTLRGKSWKSCLNWLVFLGSLDQSLRAKFKLMLLTVAFGPGQQDWDRKRREERGVSSNVPSNTVLHLSHRGCRTKLNEAQASINCGWLWLVF